MKVSLTWSERMRFTATAGSHSVTIDAPPPVGDSRGMMPKELLLASMASCTAMDVAALLRKHRQGLDGLTVTVDAPVSQGQHPRVFVRADITFDITGAVDPVVAVESVRSSQTVFCGVSAMLSRAFPIHYRVHVNGTLAGEGQAEF